MHSSSANRVTNLPLWVTILNRLTQKIYSAILLRFRWLSFILLSVSVILFLSTLSSVLSFSSMAKMSSKLTSAENSSSVIAMAAARDGATLLDQFLQRTPQAKIVFRQTSLDEGGRELTTSDGKFWYKRPDLFRMEYAPPQELLMVSDGKTTWTYEADLNQVLQNPAQAAGQSALLAVLSSGSLAALDGKYILSSGVAGAWRWAVAEARDPEQTIRLLRLGFSPEDGELQQVELTDAFGGIARLDIELINREELGKDLFNFTPPPNVDVVISK